MRNVKSRGNLEDSYFKADLNVEKSTKILSFRSSCVREGNETEKGGIIEHKSGTCFRARLALLILRFFELGIYRYLKGFLPSKANRTSTDERDGSESSQ